MACCDTDRGVYGDNMRVYAPIYQDRYPSRSLTTPDGRGVGHGVENGREGDHPSPRSSYCLLSSPSTPHSFSTLSSGKWFDLSALEGPWAIFPIVSGQPEIGFGTIDPERGGTTSPKDRHARGGSQGDNTADRERQPGSISPREGGRTFLIKSCM